MLRPVLASLVLPLALLAAGPLAAAEATPAAEVTAPAAPAAAAAPATTPATPEPPKGQLLDRVVALVNDGIVTQSDLDEQIANITARLREQNTQLPPYDVLRGQVLDRLVLQELQLQRGERMGIKVSDEQINGALGEIAQRNNITLSQLPAALAQQGINYAAFRDNMRKEITLGMVRQREVLSKINVTPRELEQFLERLKKLPGEQDEYNVSHILIATPPDATQAQVDELGKKAEQIYERAKTEDFAQLAVANSNSQTALEGGALGWRKGAELPTLVAELVAPLKPGEVSKPLATPNGFHIVKLNEIRASGGSRIQDQVHARHILIKPNELQDDATVRQKLVGIRERILKGEDFSAFASSMSEDTGSTANGGDLGWAGPGTYVPEFEQTLASLKENEISEPFRSQFGWHIVQLLGRRQFDTTEENLRERAFMQLRESKADEEVELWLRKMRDEAFVDTSP